MFRAAFLWIVLTLVAGQDTALLCGMWCHVDEMPIGCTHHSQASSPSLVGDDHCTVGSPSLAFVGEDSGRLTSAQRIYSAVLVPPLVFTPPVIDASPVAEAVHGLLDRRPPVLSLRI